jgi:hypothetical protein
MTDSSLRKKKCLQVCRFSKRYEQVCALWFLRLDGTEKEVVIDRRDHNLIFQIGRDLVMFLLAKSPLVSTVDGECDSCNAETREHVAHHCTVGENGALSPCFAACPRIVVLNGVLCFLVGFWEWHGERQC